MLNVDTLLQRTRCTAVLYSANDVFGAGLLPHLGEMTRRRFINVVYAGQKPTIKTRLTRTPNMETFLRDTRCTETFYATCDVFGRELEDLDPRLKKRIKNTVFGDHEPEEDDPKYPAFLALADA